MHRYSSWTLLVVVSTCVATAHAEQDDAVVASNTDNADNAAKGADSDTSSDNSTTASDDSAEGVKSEHDVSTSDLSSMTESNKLPDDVDARKEPSRDPFFFLGLRTRLAYVPKFVFSIFGADGGKGVFFPGIGIESSFRTNNLDVVPWITFTSYAMGDVAFKAPDDPVQAYEIASSTLSSLSVGADLLWLFPIQQQKLSFTLGGALGLGVVFGSLYRTQAYPKDGNANDVGSYVKCPGPNQGYPGFCGTDNDHYNDYKEPSWLDGGSRPIVFPWVALPQIGLRWKPDPRVVLRFDTGISFPGPFFVGLSGLYGL